MSVKDEKYRMCKRCVMDTTDSEIEFDSEGICNHCRKFENTVSYRIAGNNQGEFDKIVKAIKAAGSKNEYDCVIGVSGGVDSTYLAYLCKQNGLRPLAVHLDNGWNSELAVSNIEKVLKKLDIDLYTYVIDWEEFRDLQLAFLKASTPDSEIPTDHAIYSILMRVANEKNIKYILSGLNYKTESILPITWAYGHADWKYIKNIQKEFGTKKLISFPHYSISYLFYTVGLKRVKFISLLNYIDFNKEKAMAVLEKDLGWRNYGGKHYESIYTRFFQSYILPRKFNIDKRKAHLSNLINSGLMTKEEAINELEKEICPKELLEQDKEYTIKKFELTSSEFEDIMKLPPKTFRDYKTNYDLILKIRELLNFLRKRKLFYR